MRLPFRRKHVTIRRSLFVNFALFIVLVSAVVFTVATSRSRQTIQHLSEQIIARSANQVSAELARIFDPVNQQLRIIEGWARTGALAPDDTPSLNRLFIPFLRQYNQVSRIIVADESGNEYRLLSEDDGWRTRRAYASDTGSRTVSQLWSSEDLTLQSEERRGLEYSPLNRPWWKGAISSYDGLAAPLQSYAVYWTDPYTFFTSRDPGITAALAFKGADSITRVAALDVKLIDISKFTTALKPTENGMVIVYTDAGEVVGLPRAQRFLDISGQQAEMFAQVAQLGIPQIEIAMGRRTADDEQNTFRFTAGEETWWAGFRAYP
ncbi:MAG: cache domain-containing protein, partial [Candidatus Hydrogenedentes bacterium]|nr:cache domain-containing protein [Candidatus Hydrogenedentota bacterium]